MMARDLLSSDEFDSEDGGAVLQNGDLPVNQSYAQRFEHNKKREELQRCALERPDTLFIKFSLTSFQ